MVSDLLRPGRTTLATSRVERNAFFTIGEEAAGAALVTSKVHRGPAGLGQALRHPAGAVGVTLGQLLSLVGAASLKGSAAGLEEATMEAGVVGGEVFAIHVGCPHVARMEVRDRFSHKALSTWRQEPPGQLESVASASVTKPKHPVTASSGRPLSHQCPFRGARSFLIPKDYLARPEPPASRRLISTPRLRSSGSTRCRRAGGARSGRASAVWSGRLVRRSCAFRGGWSRSSCRRC